MCLFNLEICCEMNYIIKIAASDSIWSQDSSVGIATHYIPDGLEIESWWGQDFPHLSRSALMPAQPPIHWVLGLSQE
jgi:hypothetical protein